MPKKPHIDDEPLELTHPPAELRPQPGAYHLQAGDQHMDGLTNLDLTTPRGKALFLNAANPPDIQFDEDGRALIRAVNFLLYPDEHTDEETGELRQYTKTVLIDQEGRTYATTSAYAPKRMKAAMLLWTAEDWARGIPFIITERRSRKTGRTYHDLRVEVPS